MTRIPALPVPIPPAIASGVLQKKNILKVPFTLIHCGSPAGAVWFH